MEEAFGLIHDIANHLSVIITSIESGRNPKHSEMELRNARQALLLSAHLRDCLVHKEAKCNGSLINICETVENLAPMFSDREAKVEIKNGCTPDCTAHADPELIARVISNCVDNSIKAGKATKVIIKVDETPDIVTMTIRDNGVGMNEKTLQLIGLGFTTTGGGEGTRILLDLVHKAGGTVSWKSIEDVGTEVEIKLRKAHSP
jgi:signal transduction histidine kinase